MSHRSLFCSWCSARLADVSVMSFPPPFIRKRHVGIHTTLSIPKRRGHPKTCGSQGGVKGWFYSTVWGNKQRQSQYMLPSTRICLNSTSYQERRNFIANALESGLSCTNPSIWIKGKCKLVLSDWQHVNTGWVRLFSRSCPHHAPRGRDFHDDVIKWKQFPSYWPYVRGIHRSPVNSPHKGQWRGALMFPLICTRINGWANNREAGDLRHHHGHYDVTVMELAHCRWWTQVSQTWDSARETDMIRKQRGVKYIWTLMDGANTWPYVANTDVRFKWWVYLITSHFVIVLCLIMSDSVILTYAGIICVCAQPMRDDVTM